MSKLIKQPEILPPNPDEKSDAQSCHQEILQLIDSVKKDESNLDHNYVKLGKLICKVQVNTLWISLGYESWRSYFDFLQEKFGKGRTQLYGYINTVKTLLPSVSEENLIEMGISKASELKKAVNATSKTPSETLIKKAVNPKITLSDFRQAVQEEYQIIDHVEKGEWFDLHGVYFTPDEKEEFLKAVKMAKETDPVIPNTLATHVQFKEVLVRFAQEYISQHGNDDF